MPDSVQKIMSLLCGKSLPLKARKHLFIHGTNSSCLPLMSKTGFEMLPALELLDKYNLVPFSGEIIGGGLTNPADLCLPCFGSLQSREETYNLEHIINRYTTITLLRTTPENIKNLLIEKFSQGKLNHFSNINEILILLAKYRRLGEEIPAEINPSYLKLTINLFYLYLIINDYLEPTQINWLKQALNWVDYSEYRKQGYDNFSTENIYSKLDKIDFDMEEIYKNPSQENLGKIVEFLTLPADANVNRPKFSHVRIPKIPNFISKILDRIYVFIIGFTDKYHIYLNDACAYVLMNFRDYTFANNINNYTFSNFRFDFMRDKLIEHISILKDRFNLLNRLINQPLTNAPLNETESEFIALSFPVVFIHDKDKKIELISEGSGEYRLRRGSSLILGKDITTIATDSEENKNRLNAYFLSKDLNIKVLLFDELSHLRDQLSPINNTAAAANSSLVSDAFNEDEDELIDNDAPRLLCC